MSLIVISEGICQKSVCVPDNWDKEKILANAGTSGIDSEWQLSSDTHFKTGETNPCSCDQEAGRKHYLLVC